jgi:hypothetical protein
MTIRQEEIVEQNGPADEEPDARVDRLAGIGIGRAGNRIDAGHDAVADGRQKNGGGRDEIGHCRRALACGRKRAEGAENDHRRHIGKTEKHDGP